MSNTDPADILDEEGPAAPPRVNGELMFESPWESRVFGMTMSLYQAGKFEWDEFRNLLIEEIARWEGEGHDEDEWNYYERWAAAFERLLAGKGFCAASEVEDRIEDFAQRPHGHDH